MMKSHRSVVDDVDLPACSPAASADDDKMDYFKSLADD